MSSLLTWIDRNDKRLFQYFNCYFENQFFNNLMLAFTNLGDAVFTIGITILLLAKPSLSYSSLQGAIALAFSHLIVHFLKKICLRPRPYEAIKNVKLLSKSLKDFSFPSGHTTAAFALAVSWSLNSLHITPLLLIFASLVGLSRVYLGMHYPSDTIIGALIGSLSAILTVSLF